MCSVWLGQQSHIESRTWGIPWQNSAGLSLCWSWGFQPKPSPPWECCLLTPKQPLQWTVDTEGITLHGPFVCEALGGKSSEAQDLSTFFRQISLFHSPGSLQTLLSPRNQRFPWKSAAALWTYSVITAWSPLSTHTSIHNAWGSDNDSCPQECPVAGTWEINSQHSWRSGSLPPKVNCPHTL